MLTFHFDSIPCKFPSLFVQMLFPFGFFSVEAYGHELKSKLM